MPKICYDFEILVLITKVINELIFIMGKNNPTQRSIMEGRKLEESTKILLQTPFKKTSDFPNTDTIVKNDLPIFNKAERSMKMAEKELEHAMFIEKKAINGKISRIKRGQIFGFIIALIVILCGTYLAIIGKENVGGILLGAPLVSLVALFVIGKLKIDNLKSS